MTVLFTSVSKTEEIAEVAELAARIWREYYISIITMDQIDYMIDRYQSVPAIIGQIQSQGYEYYFMQNEDFTTVGYLSVRQEEGRLFLSKFYISKEYRGNGFASLAMEFLEQLCKDRKLSSIWLTVNRNNHSSIAVYERKGFKAVREQVADIGNGFVMDDFIMEKDILDPY